MSIEQTMIARARPQMLATRLQDVLLKEARKGCQPSLFGTAVELEPLHTPIDQAQ